jgi:hypothetical protein
MSRFAAVVVTAAACVVAVVCYSNHQAMELAKRTAAQQAAAAQQASADAAEDEDRSRREAALKQAAEAEQRRAQEAARAEHEQLNLLRQQEEVRAESLDHAVRELAQKLNLVRTRQAAANTDFATKLDQARTQEAAAADQQRINRKHAAEQEAALKATPPPPPHADRQLSNLRAQAHSIDSALKQVEGQIDRLNGQINGQLGVIQAGDRQLGGVMANGGNDGAGGSFSRSVNARSEAARERYAELNQQLASLLSRKEGLLKRQQATAVAIAPLEAWTTANAESTKLDGENADLQNVLARAKAVEQALIARSADVAGTDQTRSLDADASSTIASDDQALRQLHAQPLVTSEASSRLAQEASSQLAQLDERLAEVKRLQDAATTTLGRLDLLRSQQVQLFVSLSRFYERLIDSQPGTPAVKDGFNRLSAATTVYLTQGPDAEVVDALKAAAQLVSPPPPATKRPTSSTAARSKMLADASMSVALTTYTQLMRRVQDRLLVFPSTAVRSGRAVGQNTDGASMAPKLDRAYTDKLVTIQRNGIDPPQPNYRGFLADEPRLIASNSGRPIEIYTRGGLRLAKNLWGKDDVFCAHPFSPSVPAYVDFSKLTDHAAGLLIVYLHNFPTGSCAAVLNVNGQSRAIVAVGGDVWKEFRVPFHDMDVGIEVRATGWWNEHAFITYVISASSDSTPVAATANSAQSSATLPTSGPIPDVADLEANLRHAANGDVASLSVIGHIYELHKQGTALNEAIAWYQRAARQGDAGAERALERLTKQ